MWIDTDGDDIPDWDEELFGTNPQEADSDWDGLTDFEEIFIYGTDPMNLTPMAMALDGEEV